MNSKNEYTTPKLCHYDFDLSKAWFIYFDITNPVTGQKLRKQIRGKINFQTSKVARTQVATDLLKVWKVKLASGEFDPFGVELIQSPADVPANIEEAVNLIYDLKIKALKSESIRSYKNISGLFKKWLRSKGYHRQPLSYFNGLIAQAYLDYLLLKKSYSGKTHNNHLNVLKGFFLIMVKRWPTHVKENYFAGINMLPTDIGRNTAYTEKEQKILIEYFQQHNKRMYYLIQFIFHCFLRKTELIQMKVGDINLDNDTIIISSSAAKNRRQEAVTIPAGLKSILSQMDITNAEPGHYVFGRKFQTCKEKSQGINAISEAFRKGKLKAGMNNDDGKGFYSWKHTGVIAYWKVIKDPYAIMRQCRHSDLKTTMVYLKSLGLIVNTQFRDTVINL